MMNFPNVWFLCVANFCTARTQPGIRKVLYSSPVAECCLMHCITCSLTTLSPSPSCQNHFQQPSKAPVPSQHMGCVMGWRILPAQLLCTRTGFSLAHWKASLSVSFSCWNMLCSIYFKYLGVPAELALVVTVFSPLSFSPFITWCCCLQPIIIKHTQWLEGKNKRLEKVKSSLRYRKKNKEKKWGKHFQGHWSTRSLSMWSKDISK